MAHGPIGIFDDDHRNLCPLGIFLLIASRDPFQHRSLIWFTVWSSIVHAGIMAVQALLNPQHIGHLYGDVLGLFVVAGVLMWLMPRKSTVWKQEGTFCVL
jgi:hypothetical protein